MNDRGERIPWSHCTCMSLYLVFMCQFLCREWRRLGECEEEGASFIDLGLDPDAAFVELDQFFNNGKSDAGAIETLTRR